MDRRRFLAATAAVTTGAGTGVASKPAEAAPSAFSNPLDQATLEGIHRAEKALQAAKIMLECAAEHDAVRGGALFDMRCKLAEAHAEIELLTTAADARAREARR